MTDINDLTDKAVKLLNKTPETHLELTESTDFLLFQQDVPTELNATLYEPVLCLIL